MYTNSIKKFIALTCVYICLIIGIFVLQFKNDSTISEKIGSLHISLLESTADDGSTTLKNKMSVSYNGLNFYSSDESPATITVNNKSTPLTLLSWKKTSPLSCVFDFTEKVSLTFTLSDDTSKAHLSVKVNVPNASSKVFIPYGFSSGSTIVHQSDTSVQIGSSKTAWELNAYDIGNNMVAFTSRENGASFSFFDYTKQFSFEQLARVEGISESSYQTSLRQMKSNLIAAFGTITPESTVSEQEAVSYVAAMSEIGKYSDAVDNVPSSFKKSTSRTFISAPYFNTLERMNANLQSQLQRFADSIAYAANNANYNVYTTPYLADYMCMHPGSSNIDKLLTNTAACDVSKLNLAQISGILSVYTELSDKNKALASKLKPVTEACIKRIESMCALDDNIITISENGTFLSIIEASKVGSAILAYGRTENNITYQNAGRLIINSYLKNSSSFDLKTLSEIYPIIERNNRYYPHFSILTFENGKALWTFTCANNTSYTNDNQGNITLTIDFPVSWTHYVIFSGIPKFDSIYIYDMKFRTDARFETYNSSGYVYKKDQEVLLLKSRHKSELETVRLELKKEEPAAPAAENPSVN